jgi:hypothetical protein
MKRRTFLQLLAALPFLPHLYKHPAQAAKPYDSSGGQWVFDGVNGLTFPVTTKQGCLPSALTIQNFRALSFLERLFGGN